MGRVLDALDKSGLADDTYIIVTADHGLAVGEQGLMAKQNMYECSVRMPFIIIGPNITAGRQIDAKMYQHCLFPTICDLAGISAPSTVQFSSLMPLLEGGKGQLFDSMYCAYRKFQRSVRTDRYKLNVYPEVKQMQLFDIVNDPWEVTNLAGNSANAAIISELYHELTQWQQRISDKLVLHPESFGIKA